VIYLRNAVAMWTARFPAAHLDDRLLRVDRPVATRVILLEPPDAATVAEIAALDSGGTVVVEDVFTSPDASPLFASARAMCMPVMNRPAGAPPGEPAVPVVEVRDPAALADAERVMVDGFPFPKLQPWVRGQALPPQVLDLPGWRVWLAYRHGEPAAAAYTYDDGHATGLYWLATLPAHRSEGLGRAVLSAAIAARPDHEFTLVATEAGRALYESLGFTVRTMATWHTLTRSTSAAPPVAPSRWPA
jgi:GNAT superfamily N-acetyltransferase